jgi:hypothetical protein
MAIWISDYRASAPLRVFGWGDRGSPRGQERGVSGIHRWDRETDSRGSSRGCRVRQGIDLEHLSCRFTGKVDRTTAVRMTNKAQSQSVIKRMGTIKIATPKNNQIAEDSFVTHDFVYQLPNERGSTGTYVTGIFQLNSTCPAITQTNNYLQITLNGSRVISKRADKNILAPLNF